MENHGKAERALLDLAERTDDRFLRTAFAAVLTAKQPCFLPVKFLVRDNAGIP